MKNENKNNYYYYFMTDTWTWDRHFTEFLKQTDFFVKKGLEVRDYQTVKWQFFIPENLIKT